MMTIFMMPDPEKFLKVVFQSRGQVLLHLPDGSRCDLKRSVVAGQLLRVMEPGREGLRISLTDQQDLPAFVRYMGEAAR